MHGVYRAFSQHPAMRANTGRLLAPQRRQRSGAPDAATVPVARVQERPTSRTRPGATRRLYSLQVERYSCRSATNGSISVTCRAGIKQASAAIDRNNTDTVTKVNTSVGLVSYSNDDSSRVSAIAQPIPKTVPATASIN